MSTLYPFDQYWWFYAAFVVFILFVLALDLGVFHKTAHEVSVKEAGAWTAVWISLAMVFNVLFYYYSLVRFRSDEALLAVPGFDPDGTAKQLGLEFLTGFFIEKALAVDNIFVFAVVFSYFAIPKAYQHRVLFWGILGALFFRAIFIALGSVLMQYHWVVIFFGVLLILTGVKMCFANSEAQNFENNLIIRGLNKVFRVHPKLEGQAFFHRVNGVLYVTPLFICLLFLEASDIIFAVDSVPAIFAITKEPLIVFTSNIFAILGLRSMYFLLAGVMDKFRFIKYGLAGVLVFVGLKMVYLNELFGGKFPIGWSLGIITFLIGSSILVSFIVDRKNSNGPMTKEA